MGKRVRRIPRRPAQTAGERTGGERIAAREENPQGGMLTNGWRRAGASCRTAARAAPSCRYSHVHGRREALFNITPFTPRALRPYYYYTRVHRQARVEVPRERCRAVSARHGRCPPPREKQRTGETERWSESVDFHYSHYSLKVAEPVALGSASGLRAPCTDTTLNLPEKMKNMTDTGPLCANSVVKATESATPRASPGGSFFVRVSLLPTRLV